MLFWKWIGRYYANKKNYPKAARYLIKGKKSIRSISDWKLLAESLHCIGKSDEAIELLTNLINKHPENHDLYERRAHILREVYREEEAIKDLNEAIRLNSENYMNWYTRGLAYKDLEKYDEAIRDLHEAIKREDSSTVISTYYELAVAYYNNEQYEEAVQWFLKTIDTPNVIPSYFYMLSLALDKLDRTEEAIAYLLKGKEMLDIFEGSNDKGYSLFVQKTYYSYGAFKSFERMIAPTYSFRLVLSDMYGKLGDFTNAMALMNEAIHMYPNTPELLLAKGKLYKEWNHLDKALAEFERVIKIDPENYSSYFEKASIFRMMEEEQKEIAILEELYQKDPTSPLLCYRLADVYFYYSQFEKALKMNEELLKIEDDDYLNYLQGGEILLRLNRTIDAEASFKKAIALYDHAEARYRISYILYLNEKYAESLENLYEVSKMDSSFLQSASYYIGLAHNYRAMDKLDLAISNYTKANEIEPNNPDYIWHKAECYFELKKYHYTLMECTLAISLVPEESTFYELRGRAYYKLEKHEEAKKDIEKYIQFNPNSPFGYYILGIIEYEMMDLNSALRRFERALEIDIEHYPSYLYKAYIYDRMYLYEECVASIVDWALFSHKDRGLKELEEAICSLQNFDNQIIDNAITKIHHLYGESQEWTLLN